MAEAAKLKRLIERVRLMDLEAAAKAPAAEANVPESAPPPPYVDGLEDVGLEDVSDVSDVSDVAAQAYFEKTLQNAAHDIMTAEEGCRNDTLNEKAFKVVSMATGLHIDPSAAVDVLRLAARGAGLNKSEIEKTLTSALSGGKRTPFTPYLSSRSEDIIITLPDLDEPEYESDEAESEIQSGDYPTYNWRDVLPDKNTFLDAYCAEAFKISIPREFQPIVALSIIGTAVGRHVALKRIENPTYGNLAICLTTSSAAGKGRSIRLGTSIVSHALAFDDNPLTAGLEPEGVLILTLPGSGEKLVRELAISQIDNNTKRVIKKITCNTLVTFQEMDRLVSKAGVGGSTNAFKSYIQDFTDCDDEISTSSMGAGRATVYDGFVSFLTSTQPDHLRSQFGQRDKASGLLNRFIFPFGRGIKQPAFEEVNIDRTIPSKLLKDIYDWARTLSCNNDPNTTPGFWYKDEAWTPAAVKTYTEFINEVIDPVCERDKANSDILGRMRVNTLRLILLFAINAMSETIEVEHVNSAIALYPYMRDCAMMLSAEVQKTEKSENLKMIFEAVEKYEAKHNQPPTKCGLGRTDTRIKRLNAEEFTDAAEKLVRSRQLHTVITGRESGMGKTGIRWSTQPAEYWKPLLAHLKKE